MPRTTVAPAGGKVVGPYSPAVEADGLLFLSGQIPLDPATGKLAEGGVAAQTEQCFKNLFALLAAAGLDESHVLKATVFLTDMADFAAMNEVYARQFTHPFPARSAVAVAALPLGARVEIEVIAKR